MFIAITEEGEKTMYGFRGANVNLSAGEIDVGYVKNVNVLHISGYTLLSEAQRKAALELLEAARAAGFFVSLDVGVLTAMEAADRVRSILRSIDLLFLNELEAERLARIEDPEKAAESILESGVKTVALKQGGRGCFILSRGQRVRSPAFRVNVVDTTGGRRCLCRRFSREDNRGTGNRGGRSIRQRSRGPRGDEGRGQIRLTREAGS